MSRCCGCTRCGVGGLLRFAMWCTYIYLPERFSRRRSFISDEILICVITDGELCSDVYRERWLRNANHRRVG